MINLCALEGYLVADPEKSYTSNGTAKLEMTLAVKRPFKNRDGEYDTDYIDCTEFGKGAESHFKNLSKGRLVSVVGRKQVSYYTITCDCGREHKKRNEEIIVNELHYLDSKNKNNKNHEEFEEI